MAYSESKRSGSARPRIAELLLLSACLPIAALAASQKVKNEKPLELELEASTLRERVERERPDPRRRPLLRQEQASESMPGVPASKIVEISASASGLIQKSEHRSVQKARQHHGSNYSHRQPTNDQAGHGDQQALPDASETFTEMCSPYPRVDSPNAADYALCAGDVCKETDYPQAADQCCNCGAGARFRVYANTQCVSDGGLSSAGTYHGDNVVNPLDLADATQHNTADDCMKSCWTMGDECTGITMVNVGSQFGASCYFRKGRLNYIHDYDTCYDSTCTLRLHEVGNPAAIANPLGTPDVEDNDTRLVFCDAQAILEDIDCTDNILEARPRTITTSPAPITQDDVVDNRDCWVKYLWWR